MERLRNTRDVPSLLPDNLAGSTQAQSRGRGDNGGTQAQVKLKTLDLPGVDFEAAKALVRSTGGAAHAGALGYALIVATKGDACMSLRARGGDGQ
jgi:hypothetical protein